MYRFSRGRFSTIAIAFAVCTAPGAVFAGGPPRAGTADAPDTQAARDLFKKGTELAQEAQWGEALQAFEQSARLRPHAITTFNVGACERALGRYTRARATLQRALDESLSNGGQLPRTLQTEASGYIEQIDGLLLQLTVTIAPADAAIAVDGRPLERSPGDGAPPTFVAGIRNPGLGEAASGTAFQLVLDPGAHVFTLARKGFEDVVLNKTYAPGTQAKLNLQLGKLPASLHISSNRKGAAVKVKGIDVGAAPVSIERPAGEYTVLVEDSGFVPYTTDVTLRAGEEVNLVAKLEPEKDSLTKKWWFWTAAGVVVAGAATATYALTRSEPNPVRPPLDGGGLRWTIEVP